jgi:hypothetical protein
MYGSRVSEPRVRLGNLGRDQRNERAAVDQLPPSAFIFPDRSAASVASSVKACEAIPRSVACEAVFVKPLRDSGPCCSLKIRKPLAIGC